LNRKKISLNVNNQSDQTIRMRRLQLVYHKLTSNTYCITAGIVTFNLTFENRTSCFANATF